MHAGLRVVFPSRPLGAAACCSRFFHADVRPTADDVTAFQRLVKEGIDVGGLVVDTDESAASTGVALIVINDDGSGKRTVSCEGYGHYPTGI